MTTRPLRSALKTILNASKPSKMIRAPATTTSGLVGTNTISLHKDQLAEAAFEPSSAQYKFLLVDQQRDELTSFDLQQLSLNPLKADSKERRRPCDFIAIRMAGRDSPTTRALVDTGAEVGIVKEDRIPLSEQGLYRETRLRLRLPFGELR